MVYDYSGNASHGGLIDNYLPTDRGLAPYGYYRIKVMEYAFLSSKEFAVSFWALNRQETSRFTLAYFYGAGSFHVICEMSNNSSFEISLLLNRKPIRSNFIASFIGWNLHSVSVSPDISIASKVNIYTYLNLAQVYNSFIDLSFPYSNIHMIHFAHQDDIANTGSILYEMWIHVGLSNITELSDLISTSNLCGCTRCPTSPNTLCLPNHPKTSNSIGQACPSSCISNQESCDSSLKCITKSKAECKYGLYDSETLECLFFCPGNSCNCSTVTDSITRIKSFICNCITGYKSISSVPPACISNRCLAHHPEGYRHVCDVTETGYILDSVGDCCICASDYTQVSSNPIVCMNIPHCLNYILSSGSYICSSCALGYEFDIQGNCKECDTNYAIDQSSPFTCLDRIEDCVEYIHNGVCKRCNQGYYPSNSGLECIPQNCLAYDMVLDDYMCLECSKGYQIDSDGKCNLCEASYDTVLRDPFTCVPKIENCLSYKQSGVEFICEMCNIGHKLSSSGLCDECDANYSRVEPESGMCEPDILNCLDHEISEDTLKCISCDEGYSIDIDYECKDCDAGYIKLPQESSICIREINNCSEYGLYQRKWVCTECSLGYELDENKECNLCALGYTYSENSTNECILMPDSAESSGNLDNEEEDAVSSIQINRGEVLESSNNIAITITIVSNSLSSMLSLDANTLILYINTIKILSFIQYLNINMPYEIQKQQGSTSNYMKKINILSYIKIQNENLDDYIRSISDNDLYFLSQTNYQIAILIAIFICNTIIYYIVKYAKGKLKEYAVKILKYFKYTIYIQFCLITYLDIAYSSFSKIIHVRYI